MGTLHRAVQGGLAVAVVIVAWALLPAIAWGDLYVLQSGGGYGTVARYTDNGVLVNPTVATGFQMYGPQAMTVAGNTLYVVSGDVGTNGTVGAYTTSGTVLNASLITGLNNPLGLAVSGSSIFVSSYTGGTVGKYDLTGHPINATLLSGLTYGPTGVAISGNTMYLGILGTNTIAEYDTSGNLLNGSLIQNGSLGPYQVVLAGGNLFVLNEAQGVIGEYTTAGATVNAALITGLTYGNHIPVGMATDGLNLFVSRPTANGYVISEYSTSGVLENPVLITGGGPVAWGQVPEPASVCLLGLGSVALLWRRGGLLARQVIAPSPSLPCFFPYPWHT